MNRILIIAAISMACSSAMAQHYMGRANQNPYDPQSTANPYGRYGSQFSPDSINNAYGRGSYYSPDSPRSPYGHGPSLYGR